MLLNIFAFALFASLPPTETLIRWSEVNSGSSHQEGLNKMARILQQDFANEISLQWDPARRSLSGTRQAVNPQLKILLVGHLDTVFEKDHSFQKVECLGHSPFLFSPALQGPGVADAKGGLLLILQLLHTMREQKDIEWRVFIAADEEIGGKKSKESLLRFGKDVDLALIFEPGWFLFDSMSVAVPARVGGNAHLRWTVSGKEAHVAVNPKDGRSAVKALAEHILAFEDLNNRRPGLSVNATQLQSSKKLNVRPKDASMKVSFRYENLTDEDFIREQVERIRKDFEKDGISIQAELEWSWHPQRLSHHDLVKVFAEISAYPVVETQTLARSSGAYLAAAGIPTLEAMGLFGENFHSDRELVYLGSLQERLTSLKQFIQRVKKKAKP